MKGNGLKLKSKFSLNVRQNAIVISFLLRNNCSKEVV